MKIVVPELPNVYPYWYLATPYTISPRGMFWAFMDASRVAALLIMRGVDVYCPVAHGHPIETYGDLGKTDHDFWMDVNDPFVKTAGGLLVAQLPGWKDSRGIAAEIRLFLNKPIRYIECEL